MADGSDIIRIGKAVATDDDYLRLIEAYCRAWRRNGDPGDAARHIATTAIKLLSRSHGPTAAALICSQALGAPLPPKAG